ncbi:MAG: alpha/beta fold hydrolase [Deltaproteobacteria bacterium]|nr:alpha/beta fold hydrolase [Deltaproteobacteria bacterium]
MTSSYSFRYLMGALADRFTTYSLDLPGAGRSDAPLEMSYDPSTLGKLVLAATRRLGIAGCPIVGNSMGGYVSLWAGLEAPPGCMARLVVIHAPGFPEFRLSLLGALLGSWVGKRVFDALISRNPLKWCHTNVHYYDESLKSLEEASEYGEPLRSSAGKRALEKYLLETMSIRDIRKFQKILDERRARGTAFPVPLLLMYADRDPMVRPEYGRRYRDLIPESELVVLSEASHFAHVDAVDRLLPPLLRFLDGGRASHE